MIHSMTGFGEARTEDEGRVYHFELRSVNNRYLKTSTHLPEEFAFCESDLERLIRGRLVRGSINARLHIRDVDGRPAVQINSALLAAYLEHLLTAAGHDQRITIDAAGLLMLPGVTQPAEVTEEERAERWALLERLAGEALDALVTMRQADGAAIEADLAENCDVIRRSLEQIRARTPRVVQEYRDRLMQRIQELVAGSNVRLAEDDLLKEVSIYAERSDISEELSRLAAHVDQFKVLMAAEVASGRKLEFVAQEMLREANTIGSKTGDGAIAREIVEIKSAIDRIKEQVLNAE